MWEDTASFALSLILLSQISSEFTATLPLSGFYLKMLTIDILGILGFIF